jgi:hypothetical protein
LKVEVPHRPYLFVELRGVASHKGVDTMSDSDTCQPLIGYVNGSKLSKEFGVNVLLGRQVEIFRDRQAKRRISDELQSLVRDGATGDGRVRQRFF